MSAILKTSIGKIIISDDYILKIAGVSVMECYGIVGMASKSATDGIASLLKSENVKKGVKVKTNGDESISIELFVIVKYGVSISAVAANIIDTVKYKVENLTGLNVQSVDVVVQGIRV